MKTRQERIRSLQKSFSLIKYHSTVAFKSENTEIVIDSLYVIKEQSEAAIRTMERFGISNLDLEILHL